MKNSMTLITIKTDFFIKRIKKIRDLDSLRLPTIVGELSIFCLNFIQKKTKLRKILLKLKII
jgi:hypothetical protein